MVSFSHVSSKQQVLKIGNWAIKLKIYGMMVKSSQVNASILIFSKSCHEDLLMHVARDESYR